MVDSHQARRVLVVPSLRSCLPTPRSRSHRLFFFTLSFYCLSELSCTSSAKNLSGHIQSRFTCNTQTLSSGAPFDASSSNRFPASQAQTSQKGPSSRNILVERLAKPLVIIMRTTLVLLAALALVIPSRAAPVPSPAPAAVDPVAAALSPKLAYVSKQLGQKPVTVQPRNPKCKNGSCVVINPKNGECRRRYLWIFELWIFHELISFSHSLIDRSP